MNALDDLRSTLATHAGEVVVSDPAARRTAVHERIRVVRRSRAGGAFVAAAAAVAIGAVAVLGSSSDLDARPAPADIPDVVGISVPPTMTARGHEFTLVDQQAGTDGSVSVGLAKSDRIRLVSWATSGPDDDVVVEERSGNPTEHRSDDFDDWVIVPAGGANVVTVTVGDGTPGVAVYELDDTTSATAADFVPGPIGADDTDLLPDTYSSGGFLWEQVLTTSRTAGVSEFEFRVPADIENVLVLTSVEAVDSGVVLSQDFGSGDRERIELSRGSATGSQGGYLRQPGDRVAFDISDGEARVTVGYYLRADRTG